MIVFYLLNYITLTEKKNKKNKKTLFIHIIFFLHYVVKYKKNNI